MADDQASVLVVEDDRDTAQFAQTVLARRGGMDVTVAHDPMPALEIVAQRTFDAVLTDIQMPGMSGLDLLGASGLTRRRLEEICAPDVSDADRSVTFRPCVEDGVPAHDGHSPGARSPPVPDDKDDR